MGLFCEGRLDLSGFMVPDAGFSSVGLPVRQGAADLANDALQLWCGGDEFGGVFEHGDVTRCIPIHGPDFCLAIDHVREAVALGVSLGEFVRRALASALNDGESCGSNDTLLADRPAYKGTAPDDAAENHDAYLYGIRPCIRRFTHRGLGGVR